MYYDYGYGIDFSYFLVIIGFIITMLAQLYLTSSYSKYKKIENDNGISGREAARKILDKNGLSKVKVKEIGGNLTDHYDPREKTVNLSSDIYNGTTIAAVAVASHECGHAIQDKEGYFMLRLRSSIVPIVNLSTRIGYIVLMISLIAGLLKLALVGFILVMAALIFQIITLPVEFNASSRAKKKISELNLISESEQDGASRMLFAAALTYVASMISTLLQMLRFFLMIVGRRNRR